MKKNSKFVLLLICFFLIGFLYFWARSLANISYAKEPLVKDEFMLDTLVTIKAHGKSGRKVEAAVKAAFQEMARVEKEMNYYDSKSELSKINRLAAQESLKIPASLVRVIELSLDYYWMTDGAFDITIAPLMDLWSFGQKNQLPTPVETDRALALVGSENIALDKEKSEIRLLKSGCKIDLGGVAKGYAVDRAIEVLKRHGIRSALVTTGSTTRVIGQKPGGEPWKIGIEDPRDKNSLIGILELQDGESLSTSGDYQQFFVRKGKRYHHILDPDTGRPAQDYMSVTVITIRSCAEADILSTALFVLGYPDGMKYVEKTTDLEAVVVTIDGKVRLSNRLKDKVKELKKAVTSS